MIHVDVYTEGSYCSPEVITVASQQEGPECIAARGPSLVEPACSPYVPGGSYRVHSGFLCYRDSHVKVLYQAAAVALGAHPWVNNKYKRE